MRRLALAIALGFAFVLVVGASTGSAVAIEGPGFGLGGRDFYVSPSGSDRNQGRSPNAPWRTLAKVDAAALLPGDRVHLEGGTVFTEPLAPYAGMAGTFEAPIVFDSYGDGQATVAASIYLKTVSNLTFEDLYVSPATGKGVFSSATGGGAQGITLRNLTISDVPRTGINSDNPADEGWLIENVGIQHTGDSGIYFKGSDFSIRNSTIVDTGTDASIRYPRHAIYAAGPDTTIVNNTIADFSSSGISLRFQNAFVEGNRISGGAKGISFDNQATAPGRTDILYNTVSDVSDAGIVVATPASESFLVADNTIVGAGNYGIYVQVVPALTIANNIIEATSDTANLLNVRPSSASYSEHNNLWYGGSSSPFYWNGTARTFLEYLRFSGQGASDLTLDPLLDAELVPNASSPAIDAGATEVDTLLGYLAQCDGHFFHYCGTAPDLGSSERPPPAPPPLPTGTLDIGEQNILAADDNENGDLLVAQSAVLDQAATILSLSFYVTNPAGTLRLGIYSDVSGTPGEKLAETEEITPTVGWNTAAVMAQVLLPAGTYWLAYLPSDNDLGFRKADDTTSSGRYYSFAYGPLPATFSTSPGSTGSHWSFYATLDTSAVLPPPSVGTPPGQE